MRKSTLSNLWTFSVLTCDDPNYMVIYMNSPLFSDMLDVPSYMTINLLVTFTQI
jgi:hypothetical protein